MLCGNVSTDWRCVTVRCVEGWWGWNISVSLTSRVIYPFRVCCQRFDICKAFAVEIWRRAKFLRKPFIINIYVWYFFEELFIVFFFKRFRIFAFVQTRGSPAASVILRFWYHYLCVSLTWQWFMVFFMLRVHHLPNKLYVSRGIWACLVHLGRQVLQ